MAFSGSVVLQAGRGGRRLVHPVVDSFLPVTYSPAECRRRIQRLDPTGARNDPNANRYTDRRIVRLAAELGVDEALALKYLDEAGSFLVNELVNHIYKEDNILYQLALQTIAKEEWAELKKRCDEIGYCCFTPANQG